MARTGKKPTSPNSSRAATPSDAPSRSRASGRDRRPTKRLQEANANTNEEEARRAAAKESRLERATERLSHQTADAVVVQRGDSDQVAYYKGLADAAIARANAAEHELAILEAQSEDEDLLAEGSVPRPRNIQKVTIKDIRKSMGIDGRENNHKWLDIRAIIRRSVTTGGADLDLTWKDQKSLKLSRIYEAIEEKVPALRVFKNNWVTAILVRAAFDGRRGYGINCRNPESSVGKKWHYRQMHPRPAVKRGGNRRKVNRDNDQVNDEDSSERFKEGQGKAKGNNNRDDDQMDNEDEDVSERRKEEGEAKGKKGNDDRDDDQMDDEDVPERRKEKGKAKGKKGNDDRNDDRMDDEDEDISERRKEGEKRKAKKKAKGNDNRMDDEEDISERRKETGKGKAKRKAKGNDDEDISERRKEKGKGKARAKGKAKGDDDRMDEE